jgi:hypothetical protein
MHDEQGKGTATVRQACLSGPELFHASRAGAAGGRMLLSIPLLDETIGRGHERPMPPSPFVLRQVLSANPAHRNDRPLLLTRPIRACERGTLPSPRMRGSHSTRSIRRVNVRPTPAAARRWCGSTIVLSILGLWVRVGLSLAQVGESATGNYCLRRRSV